MDGTAIEPGRRAQPQPIVGGPVGDEAQGRDSSPSILDRTIDLSAVGWVTIGWVVVAMVAIALRFARLDVWALTPEEARRAYDAYSLYLGRPMDPGDDLPTTAPLFLVLQAFGFFLFGVTDATARIMPALIGVAMIPLAWLLRPYVGRTTALGMGALLALSPTLVYGSRLGAPAILVAATALGLVVAVLRIGLPGASDGAVRRRSTVAGIALALLFASGPVSLTVLIALAIGAVTSVVLGRGAGRDDALARSGRAVARVNGTLASVVAGVLATLLVVFTRLFSDIGAIAGLGETFADWARLVGTAPNTVPTQYFLLSLLLYEPLAVAFAIVAAVTPAEAPPPAEPKDDALPGRLGWQFFAGWFVAILLLLSLASGRMPDHLIQVALPLVLLGGLGLGELAAQIAWRDVFRGPGGLLVLCYLGVVIGLVAFGILAARIDDSTSRTGATFQALFVAFLVILPLGYGIFVLAQGERLAGRGTQVGRLALLVVALILAAFTLRSTIGLNFYNADEGNEPLAQKTATGAVRPMVDRLLRLSRDTTLNRASVRDTTGGRSLVIALDADVEWPFRWYFREFPDLRVVPAGTAANVGAEVVIAPRDAGMAEAGYTPRGYPYLNGVPAAYSEPDVGNILATIARPDRWIDGVHYLLFREIDNPAVGQTVAVGLNSELASRVAPSAGPFNLYDRAGAGSGRGQFNLPRGVAVDPRSGVIYVVDMGNLRVERYDENGVFIGIWGGGEEGAIKFGSAGGSLGPTGIAVGPDGLVYVADTWNHRVVAIDSAGVIVREIGSGEETNLGDDPAAVIQSPGLFFGPRSVVVHNDEIYVADTGNERIQVFGLDGVFRRVWGGFGSGPDQLKEPVGIAVGPDGMIYVADSHNGRISVFTPDGAPIRQFQVAAWEGGTYIEPYLTWGTDGLLYATSRLTSSVEVFDRGGALVDSIQVVDGLALQQPIGIATAPDGAIVISDAGRNAVFRYLPPDALPESDAGADGSIDDGAGGDDEVGTDAGGEVVLPGGATPDASAGSNQFEPAAPSNQAPPPI